MFKETPFIKNIYFLDMYSPDKIKKYKNCLPDLKIFLAQRCLWQRWWKYFFEYLCEVETEFEDSLECESGVHMGWFTRKTRGQKSHATVPLSKGWMI